MRCTGAPLWCLRYLCTLHSPVSGVRPGSRWLYVACRNARPTSTACSWVAVGVPWCTCDATLELSCEIGWHPAICMVGAMPDCGCSLALASPGAAPLFVARSLLLPGHAAGLRPCLGILAVHSGKSCLGARPWYASSVTCGPASAAWRQVFRVV